jgi:enoyl-CoA hydratase/carnithine racemase
MGSRIVVQAAEDWDRCHLGFVAARAGASQRASRRLSAQASVRAAVVAADVFAQDALGVALAEEQEVIEAVATERPNQALANRVGLRRSGRRAEAPHPKTVEPRAEARIVDAIAVVQQIARGASPTAWTMRCATHAPVGCAVTPTWTIRRRSREVTTNAQRVQKWTVTTVKKSQAQTCEA